jgi:sigma-70-like protein
MATARSARRTARAARDGEPEAVQLPGRFEYFYLQEYPKVVALAYALSGSSTGVEDIAQEAFLRAYRDWDRLAPMSIGLPGSGAWLPTWPPLGCGVGWSRRVR